MKLKIVRMKNGKLTETHGRFLVENVLLNNKAPGIDGIDKLIKNLPKKFIVQFNYIINAINITVLANHLEN